MVFSGFGLFLSKNRIPKRVDPFVGVHGITRRKLPRRRVAWNTISLVVLRNGMFTVVCIEEGPGSPIPPQARLFVTALGVPDQHNASFDGRRMTARGAGGHRHGFGDEE